MKITISFLFTTLIYLNSQGQINKPIKIEEIYITDSSQLKSQSDFIAKDSIFSKIRNTLFEKLAMGNGVAQFGLKTKKLKENILAELHVPIL